MELSKNSLTNMKENLYRISDDESLEELYDLIKQIDTKDRDHI